MGSFLESIGLKSRSGRVRRERSDARRAAKVEANKKTVRRQNSFLSSGNLQSTSSLNISPITSPGLVQSVFLGSKQLTNNPLIGGQESLDKLTKSFEDRRKAIQQRIAVPGRSVFLTGR